jgi:N-acetylglucosamine-6-phosphate deacetylase
MPEFYPHSSTGNAPEAQPRGRVALAGGRVILPDRVAGGVAVVVEGGKIAGIAAAGDLGADTEIVDVGGRYVAPGLIDIHTHGARGHTFNEPTAEAFAAIAAANAAAGVTALLATIATDALPNLCASLAFCGEWMRQPRPGAQVLGAHLEGPYFSMAQRGAQDPAHIRNPDDGSADLLLAHHSIMRIMSFAPELPGALELTERIAALGIVPAAGHSDARDEQVRAAMGRGLHHTIHIWSGQSTTVREGPWRRPGLLEATLAFDGLTAELIADNRHLPPTLMRLAYKCLGPDRLCAISDATSGAGLPEGARFRMGGMEYEVHDGVGMLLDRSAFAGSTTLLGKMVPILRDEVGVPLHEAVRMASLTPARVIGVDDRKGSLAPGKDADIAIFEQDFTAWKTMIAGRWAYVAEKAAP